MLRMLFALFVVVLSFFACSTDAQNSLVSNALGSNMVLQQAPQSAVLWGWTPAAGQTVTVSFNGQTITSQPSGEDSSWSVSLPPTPASNTQAYTIQVTSQDGSQSVTLQNVLFGDVYICGGQSNMQFTVSMALNASQAIADAANYPNIRIFTVGQGNISYQPLDEFASIEQGWSIGSSQSVGGPDWDYMSAVCWFFVKELYDQYQIPIGAVSSNWGGTIIQAWSSPDAIAACPSSSEEIVEVGLPKGPLDNPNQNNVLWNAMIVPLLPMRVKGALWYQGEANINQETYACMFPAMISDWRIKWNLSPPEFGFYFVQLAPYTEDQGASMPGLPDTRLNQALALELPYVGMATAIDLGDLGSPEGNIHPRDKETVGYRLSLVARQQLYGEMDLVVSGPVPNQVTLTSPPPNVVVEIGFRPDTLAANLVLDAAAACPPNINAVCGWYEVESSDGAWHNATGVALTADGKSLQVAATLPSPLSAVFGVRYAYGEWPVASLFNSDGLPAPPFLISLLETQ